MGTVATIFGMIFVSVILICLVWTIGSYIADAYPYNNKLEENIKKFDEKQNGYEK